jgi:peptidase M15-like protein
MALMKRVQTQHALQAYLANPNDDGAYNALASFDPQAAATIQQQQMLRRKMSLEQEAEQRRIQAGTQAAGGDIQGGMKTALSGGDTDFADALSKLDDNQKKAAADFWTKAGPVAYKLSQIKDPAQRQALWNDARPILQSEGADPALLDKFDPTNEGQVNAAVLTAQKVSDLIEQGKIVWHQQGENPSFATDALGHPIGSQNPAAGHSAPAAPVHTEGRPAAPDLKAATSLGGHFGTVTSAKRSPEHNREVGGVPNSYHLSGHAIDIARKPGVSHSEVVQGFRSAGYEILEQLDEGDHSHIALAGGPHPQAGPVRIASRAAFNSLPSGAEFIAPDGTHRRKP